MNFDEAITGLENSGTWPMPSRLQVPPEQSFNRPADYTTRYNDHKSFGGYNVFDDPHVISTQPQRSRLRMLSNPVCILEKNKCYTESKAPCQGFGGPRRLTKARNFSKKNIPSNFYAMWPKKKIGSPITEANVFSQFPVLDSLDKRSLDCLDGESGVLKTDTTPRRKNPNKHHSIEV